MNRYEKEVLKEVFSKGYFKRISVRAKRRKSPWNLLLLPLILGWLFVITCSLLGLMWWVHTLAFPEHAGRFLELWAAHSSSSSTVPGLLFFAPLLFVAIPLSMMATNLCVWQIPAARQAFEQEARGHKFTTFKEAMAGLWLFTKILAPICLVLSLIGALTLDQLP